MPTKEIGSAHKLPSALGVVEEEKKVPRHESNVTEEEPNRM